MGYLAKGELLKELLHVCEAKVKYTVQKYFLMGMMAGIFIALSAFIYTIVCWGMHEFNPVVVKLIASMCFTFGIFAVVVAGADLFTGNILVYAYYLDKKTTLLTVFKNWTYIYLFNLVGSVMIALMIYFAHLAPEQFTNYLHKMVMAKVNYGFVACVLKGIGCNILVCLGVWMAYASKDVASKFIGSGVPIVIFLVCGFEHCVANMFYFSLSLLTSDITIGQILANIVPVTIGNILGGMFIAAVYYYAYRPAKEK